PVFLVNSRQIHFSAAPSPFNKTKGTPSPEVTGLICRVPSRAFSRAPENLHRAYLCRFQYGHSSCPVSAFLGFPSNDFGIINALALAGRTLLAVRSPLGKRPDTLNR